MSLWSNLLVYFYHYCTLSGGKRVIVSLWTSSEVNYCKYIEVWSSYLLFASGRRFWSGLKQRSDSWMVTAHFQDGFCLRDLLCVFCEKTNMLTSVDDVFCPSEIKTASEMGFCSLCFIITVWLAATHFMFSWRKKGSYRENCLYCGELVLNTVYLFTYFKTGTRFPVLCICLNTCWEYYLFFSIL